MKSCRLYPLFLTWILHFSAAAQPGSFDAFLEKLKNETDSARYEKLYDYTYETADNFKLVESGQAAAEMMRMAEASRKRDLIGRTYMAMGYLDRAQNNVTLAVASYQKALTIFHNLKDFRREIRAYQRIAGVYISTRDLKLAEHYLQRGLKLARDQQMPREVAFLYTDLATIEDIKKNYTKALSYNQEAIEILKKTGDDYSATEFNQGIIFKNAGLYKESIATYKAGLEKAIKNSDKYIEAMIYTNLPNTLVLMNDLDQAEMYAKKALEMVNFSPQRMETFVEAYGALTKIYEKRGQFEQAFEFQKKLEMYRDSVFNQEKSRQLIETETRFQTREKQQQIQHLDEENLEKRRQLLWLYGGVSLLTLLLGIALWQYRTIRKVNGQLGVTNTTLSEANHRISIQSGQLKELMQELHHRVKNNLAIVSSLLSLQANRLDDEKAAQAVLEGQQRVEAMSLIHNQLYQTDNVTGVNMQEYIGDLAQGLMQSFKYKDNFDLRLDIAPIMLDVQLAVPLGLILNELVTNAFKHAYKNVDAPALHIRLWQEDKLYLEIKDNGPGIDPEKWQKGGSSFGKRLIKSLTKQANGTLEVDSIQGSRFLLTFPAAKLVEFA
ncbi:tetratricopeptide repeat-containing sensor histidine kinase [Dyadobacter luticola]|uniref:histidine kinase n=1 Tax=Dyadobacter luticola TaxID=1979387 RepID=A0A5R9L1G1_9BACT|nr:sensor histidine kinase [Dyadobacter luticola]TLV02185.1 hypothetical protein FEN17_00660 [Dyadobacter luticola]